MRIGRSLPARLALGVLCTLLAALGLAPAGAAAATTTSGRTWQVLVGAEAGHQAIQTMGFYPKHLWVDQGDTVVFKANAGEIHTVTFLAKASPCPGGDLCSLPPQGFSPTDPAQVARHGSRTYDGSGYYNSGVMSTARGGIPLPPTVHIHQRYALRIGDSVAPGSYRYYCLVHGRMMSGTVIVQQKGTPYPYTQHALQRLMHQAVSRDLRDGFAVWRAARVEQRKLTRRNGHPTVLVGAMDDRASVMRFILPHGRIRTGERVTFMTTSTGEPHTVTFGNDMTGCGQPPCDPEQPWNVTTLRDGNEKATFPGHNGGFTGDRNSLNTGLLLGLPPRLTHLPNSVTIRFSRAGTFPFMCALHDYLGMVGSIRVAHRR